MDLENALLDAEEIKKNWLSLIDAILKHFIAQNIQKEININVTGLKNLSDGVYKPHDNMTTCQHDNPWHVLHDRGYKGERQRAYDLIKSISPEHAQRIDAHLKIYESQALFELEKQLPTQSLSEETVRAEYSFFNHHTEYTEIRAIYPGQGRNKVIQFVSSEEDFLEYVKLFDGKWQVYLGINQRYRLGSGEIGAGTMEDVDQVGAVVLDIDCKRANKKEPACDLELDAAFAVANRITVDFISRGFKAPVRVMSGNGWQLRWAIPHIELNDSNRREVNWKLQEFQRFVKANYENEFVEIDNIGDVPRIIKVCGTKSIKGTHTWERPHRYSYALDTIVREEDTRLREFILSFEKPKRELREEGELPRWRGSLDFDKLVEKDEKLGALYAGRWQRFGYKSRSEAELALVCKLIYYGFSKREIWRLLGSSGIGKWVEKSEGYKELAYDKALEFVR